MFRNVNWSSVIGSLIMAVIGILVILYPEVTGDVAASILGIGAILFGGVYVLLYFFKDLHESLFSEEFVIGLTAIIFGVVVLTKRDLIISLIPVILGLVILISGFSKLQRGVVAKRIGYESSTIYLALAAVSIVLGIIVMFFLNGEDMRNALFILIGIGLIYSGATDLFANFFLAAKFNAFVKSFEEKKQEAEGKVIDAEAKETDSVKESDTSDQA
jgi:uncharacterized membrane protein HdeD (DUF308 family)